MKISELKPLEKNPFKSKGDKQIEAIGKSINSFKKMMGLRGIVIDENNEILGGNKRYFALKKLGYKEIPDEWIIKVNDLSEQEKREFVVKDNSHWGSEWDFDMLKEWNVDLEEYGVEFKESSISLSPEDIVEIEAEDPDTIKTEIKEGDIFSIGRHRLMCGDAAKDYEKLMEGKKSQMSFTDPPWNVAYGKQANHPSWKHLEIINDNLGKEFKIALKDWFSAYKNISEEGSMLYAVMSAQEWGNIMQVLEELGFHWSSTIIWAKDSLLLSRKDYHTQYEPIWYGWLGAGRLFPLKDRKQSDLWQIRRPKNSEEHPTMKPIELCARAILNSSKEESIITDLFGGSGSTMVAAEQLKRPCYMMELDPNYCQVIINRMRKLNPDIEVKCLNRDIKV